MSYRNLLMSVIFASSTVLFSACTSQTPLEASTSSQTDAKAANTLPATLPNDPKIYQGVLQNGMKYIILKHPTPEKTAAMRFYVDAGALQEQDNQNGLAHFLEHMAFNGSKNVPEGEMTRILERKGLAFGADTNANTGLSQTTYMLNLPNVDEDTIDTGLFIMRETASNLTLSSDAIDRERGVIQSERRGRLSPLQRRQDDIRDFIFPESLLKDRNVIGDPNILNTASRERFVEFYDTYYRPDNTTLFIVGDIEEKDIEDKIRNVFSDWSASTPKQTAPDIGNVSLNKVVKARAFYHPEIPTLLGITAVRPVDIPFETQASREEEILQIITNAIINKRLSVKALKPNAAFAQAFSTQLDLENIARIHDVTLVTNPENWEEALSVALQEIRRVQDYGFTKSEINEQVETLHARLKTAAAQADARPNIQLATQIFLKYDDGKALTSPQQDLEIFEAFKSSITKDTLLKTYQALWDSSEPILHFSNAQPIDNAEAKMLDVYTDSLAVKIDAPIEEGGQAFSYTDFGPAGQVAEDQRLADLNVRHIRFENNIRLNIKQTDFEANNIQAILRVDGGLAHYPKTLDGLTGLTGMFVTGGLKAHDINEIQTLTAGKTVQLNLALGETALTGRASTTADDLLLQLQLWAAYVTAPGYRTEGQSQWQQQAVLLNQLSSAEPTGVLSAAIPRIMRSGDVRFGLGPNEDISKRSFSELKTVLGDDLAEGAIEITIVGDVDEEEIIKTVAQTFGALPLRRNQARIIPNELQVSFPKDRRTIRLTHKGSKERAIAFAAWSTSDAASVKQEAAMTLLGRVMQSKTYDSLREELGAAYTPVVQSAMSSTFKDYGIFLSFAEVETSNVDIVLKRLQELTRQLSEPSNITTDDLLRARRPLLEQIKDQKKTNAYWVNGLSSSQLMPQSLDKLRNLESIYESLTISDLQDVAAKFLTQEAPLLVRIEPQ